MRVALKTPFGQIFDILFAVSNGLFGVRSATVREGWGGWPLVKLFKRIFPATVTGNVKS
jgi:hypothetical protein